MAGLCLTYQFKFKLNSQFIITRVLFMSYSNLNHKYISVSTFYALQNKVHTIICKQAALPDYELWTCLIILKRLYKTIILLQEVGQMYAEHTHALVWETVTRSAVASAMILDGIFTFSYINQEINNLQLLILNTVDV